VEQIERIGNNCAAERSQVHEQDIINVAAENQL
jgi:hypothetical protein